MSHILIIEPDRILADIYRESLTSIGYKVVICSSAQSAITAADATLPDLVILELQLIEHSGIEFLYEFRSYPEWQDIPVIVLSNVPPSEFGDSQEILTNALGVKVYHYKPLTSLRNLMATVNEYSSLSA